MLGCLMLCCVLLHVVLVYAGVCDAMLCAVAFCGAAFFWGGGCIPCYVSFYCEPVLCVLANFACC